MFHVSLMLNYIPFKLNVFPSSICLFPFHLTFGKYEQRMKLFHREQSIVTSIYKTSNLIIYKKNFFYIFFLEHYRTLSHLGFADFTNMILQI